MINGDRRDRGGWRASLRGSGRRKGTTETGILGSNAHEPNSGKKRNKRKQVKEEDAAKGG